jgi:hypothetical protein
MLPFSGYGSIDCSERKALLYAALFSCLFIVVLGVARPHPRTTRTLTTEVFIPPPGPYKVNEPDLSSLDSFAKFRVRPEHFEQVDFTNHSYGSYRASNGEKLDLTLEAGLLELPNNSGWFELKDVYYIDLTGDNRQEAFVWLSHETCSPSCNGASDLFYVYAESNGKLKPIWQYETGSYADGCGLRTLTLGGPQIVLQLFGSCRNPARDRPNTSKFIAKDLTFIIFKFDGRRFVTESSEVFESPATNIANYEPEIRIY